MYNIIPIAQMSNALLAEISFSLKISGAINFVVPAVDFSPWSPALLIPAIPKSLTLSIISSYGS